MRHPWLYAIASLLLLVTTARAAPSISMVTPNGGYDNDLVTITGSGFTGATAVRFGNKSRAPEPGGATQRCKFASRPKL